MTIQTLRTLLLGFAIATLSTCVSSNAQEVSRYPEYRQYQESAGGLSALYRGRQATRYQSRYNGNYYWDMPEYSFGDIVYEGRLYTHVNMNIDAVRQEVLVRNEGDAVSIALPAADVQYFNLGDRNFVSSGTAGAGLQDGLFEVLHKGSKAVFYKRVDKTLTSSPNSANGSGIGYNDPNYDNSILTYFACRTKYYLSIDGGDAIQIKSRGALKKQFKDYKKQINHIAEEQGLLSTGISLGEYCRVILDNIDL